MTYYRLIILILPIPYLFYMPRILRRVLYLVLIALAPVLLLHILNDGGFKGVLHHSGVVFGKGVLVIRTQHGENHGFNVEIATDARTQAQGLMNRSHLDPDAGMLFIFTPPRYIDFWMKNTPIPLDILFIDQTGTITHIAPHTTPLSTDRIPSQSIVSRVLEINAGLADALHIAVGDHVVYDIP